MTCPSERGRIPTPEEADAQADGELYDDCLAGRLDPDMPEWWVERIFTMVDFCDNTPKWRRSVAAYRQKVQREREQINYLKRVGSLVGWKPSPKLLRLMDEYVEVHAEWEDSL